MATNSIFNSPRADLVLITSDDIIFRVRRAILTEASSYWATRMRSLENDQDSISVPEHSSTLQALLQFCYPIEDPELKNLEEVAAVLHSAEVYGMAETIALVKQRYDTLILEAPIKALKLGWDAESTLMVRMAMQHMLTRPLGTGADPQEHQLDDLSELARTCFFQYRRSCVLEISDLVTTIATEGPEGVEFTGSGENITEREGAIYFPMKASGAYTWRCEPCKGKRELASWYREYMEAAKQALFVRPSAETVQRVEVMEGAWQTMMKCKKGSTGCSNSEGQYIFEKLTVYLRRKVDMVVDKVSDVRRFCIEILTLSLRDLQVPVLIEFRTGLHEDMNLTTLRNRQVLGVIQ
jgi:hypothetical protein